MAGFGWPSYRAKTDRPGGDGGGRRCLSPNMPSRASGHGATDGETGDAFVQDVHPGGEMVFATQFFGSIVKLNRRAVGRHYFRETLRRTRQAKLLPIAIDST